MMPSGHGIIWRSGAGTSSQRALSKRAYRLGADQRIRMLSGLPGRAAVAAAVLTGFIDTFWVRTGAAGAGAAYAVAVVWVAGEYLSITIWQAALSLLLFWTMQAVVRARSGIVAEQTRNASFMQACWSSEDCATAAVESRPAVNARARVSRMCMKSPLSTGA